MKKYLAGMCGVLALMLAGGTAAQELAPSRGQLVYVPVYSHIDHGNKGSGGRPEQLLLSAMLSIRNVDLNRTITVRSVGYFDSEGKRIREYQTAPRELGPLASTEYLVEHRDTAGGAGASFLVVWDADAALPPPIVEAPHAYIFGPKSVVFVTSGRVLQNKAE
jgi:hypothetical protein